MPALLCVAVYLTQMNLGLVSFGGKKMARMCHGVGLYLKFEISGHRRLWDRQSVCWHSGEQ